jgi:hypothetical protein
VEISGPVRSISARNHSSAGMRTASVEAPRGRMAVRGAGQMDASALTTSGLAVMPRSGSCCVDEARTMKGFVSSRPFISATRATASSFEATACRP